MIGVVLLGGAIDVFGFVEAAAVEGNRKSFQLRAGCARGVVEDR